MRESSWSFTINTSFVFIRPFTAIHFSCFIMSFVIYIDESGDEGFSPKSSKWFSMSCIIIKKENDLSLVKHRDNICNKISFSKNKPL